MCLSGNTLYLVGFSAANQPHFAAIDVSTPTSPVIRGTKDFTDFSSGVATCVSASGTMAVVGIQGNTPRQSEVVTVNLSNIASPVQLGTFTGLPAFPSAVQLSADGNTAYVLAASQLYVLNVSQPATPSLVTNIPLDTVYGTDMRLQGNELVVATFKGVYVFNVVDPAAPVLIREYSPLSGTQGIGICTDSASQAGYIYLATLDGGIVALREQDIQPPSIYITDPLFGDAWTNSTSTINLGGGSEDNVGVTAIMWANSRGGSGQVTGPLDNWYASGIALYPGTNVLTVSAFDAAGNSGSDRLTVIYQAPKQDQAITLPAIAGRTFGDAPFPLTAASSSGLAVSFLILSGPAGVSDGTLTLLGAGVVTVRASRPGDASFNAAPSVDVSFNVAKADQAILFAHLPDRSAAEQPFPLSATASSGLPVSFQILSGPATLGANNVLTMLGGGLVTVSASQAGDSNYNAASAVVQSFNVVKIPQTISFQPLSRQTVGDAPFELSAAASSGLTVGFSVVSGPAVLSGSILTVTGPGLVTVRATQPGNAMYAAAADLERSFMVVSGINVITGPSMGTDGKFHFSFVGEFGQLYVVQLSSDLKNWIPAATNTVDALGNLDFTDSTTTLSGARFYQVVAP
jgi:hypothetical protein